MDDKIENYADYRRLRDEFYNSDGIKQYNAALANWVSYYTFETNYREVLAKVRDHFDLRSQGKLGDFFNKQPLHDYLTETTRLLHNFLASAKTLVDHTRFFVRNTYPVESSAVAEYENEVKNRFEDCPINKFTMELRIYMTHISMPFISSVMGGSDAVGRDRFAMQVDANRMQQDRWSNGAKRFIDQSEGKIDLEKYLMEYHLLIFDFHYWLGTKINQWGSVEWEKTKALQDKLMRYEPTFNAPRT